MEITEISKNYQVRRLGRDDVDAIYELCRENRIFYRYHEPFVTKESILDDMEALRDQMAEGARPMQAAPENAAPAQPTREKAARTNITSAFLRAGPWRPLWT